MTLFPWLVLVALLVILAELLLIAPAVATRAVRRRRPLLSRPRARVVVVVVLVELAALALWTLVWRPG
jgi:hypothetical protein